MVIRMLSVWVFCLCAYVKMVVTYLVEVAWAGSPGETDVPTGPRMPSLLRPTFHLIPLSAAAHEAPPPSFVSLTRFLSQVIFEVVPACLSCNDCILPNVSEQPYISTANTSCETSYPLVKPRIGRLVLFLSPGLIIYAICRIPSCRYQYHWIICTSLLAVIDLANFV